MAKGSVPPGGAAERVGGVALMEVHACGGLWPLSCPPLALPGRQAGTIDDKQPVP